MIIFNNIILYAFLKPNFERISYLWNFLLIPIVIVFFNRAKSQVAETIVQFIAVYIIYSQSVFRIVRNWLIGDYRTEQDGLSSAFRASVDNGRFRIAVFAIVGRHVPSVITETMNNSVASFKSNVSRQRQVKHDDAIEQIRRD